MNMSERTFHQMARQHGWRGITGDHLAVVAGAVSTYIYRADPKGGYRMERPIVLTREESEELGALLIALPPHRVTDSESALFGTPDPAATKVVTDPCLVCHKPADLLDPEHGFNIIDGVHESCRDADPHEPTDPDWRHDERGL